jgi:ankyrin repeat protein
LLAAGANTELKTKAGMTAYLTACMHGHVEIAEALLKANTDPTASDNWGQTAMQRCAVPPLRTLARVTW